MKTIVTLLAIIMAPIAANACTFDSECRIGQRCMKSGFNMKGICAEPTDEYGVPDLDAKTRNYGSGIRTQGCLTSVDCAIGFQCVKGDFQMRGVCVR